MKSPFEDALLCSFCDYFLISDLRIVTKTITFCINYARGMSQEIIFMVYDKSVVAFDDSKVSKIIHAETFCREVTRKSVYRYFQECQICNRSMISVCDAIVCDL